MRQVVVVVTVCLFAVGCTTRSAFREWEQKASSIAMGTPRADIEKALPPASVVVDPRSSRSPGQLAYWVDGDTLVRLWVDENDALAKPIEVEMKKRPKEANHRVEAIQ